MAAAYLEVEMKELVKYKAEIIALYRSLINHLRQSPVFYHCRYFLPVEDRFNDYLTDQLRVFAMFDKERLIGMVSAEPVDSELSMGDSDGLNMGDVFIDPLYRGQGLAAALLKYANDTLNVSGIKRLYVTHGTINPTARGFWDKHFMNGSYTMTRAIDPEMLGPIASV